MMKNALRILLPIALVALAGCRGKELPKGSNQTPVILISVDTLRSDHLAMYGYTQGSTPHLDALRKDAILYERAYSHCPLTLPSHTSILTGLLPADNGVRDNIGYRLRDDVPTLAELLKKNGYATGAAVSAFVLRRETGISRGFDFYNDRTEALGPRATLGRVQRDGAETAAVATKWINEHADKPFFFFLHLYDPHTPYEPPEPFKTRFEDEPYDGEIAYADDTIGKFIADLKEKGIYDKAMIIFLSDHGEGLWEHGEKEHGIFLYRESIQVPLVVKLPREADANTTVSDPVGLIDVFPTILEQTATSEPKHDGRSLLLPVEGKADSARRIYSETYYGKFHYGWSDIHSLIDGIHHFIQAPRSELYDLSKDHEEKNNILDQERRVYFDFKKEIDPYIKEAQAPTNIDPEEAAKLAALGYLGSTVQTEPGEELPDPKDTIGVFKEIQIAFTLYREKKYDEALVKIDALLADNRRMVDLWDLRSKVLKDLGRNKEAIEAAQEGLKLSPSATHLALQIAEINLEEGNLDDAAAHAELAVTAEPCRARETLARVYMEKKEFDKAKTEIDTCLEADPEDITALITRARLQRDKGDLEIALKTINTAVELIGQKKKQYIQNLHFIRGDILARMGNGEEAEKEFREEIDLFPDNAQAYKNLILLLAVQGRLHEATGLIRKLAEESPTPPAYIAICQVLDVLGDQAGKRYWAAQGLKLFPNQKKLREFL